MLARTGDCVGWPCHHTSPTVCCVPHMEMKLVMLIMASAQRNDVTKPNKLKMKDDRMKIENVAKDLFTPKTQSCDVLSWEALHRAAFDEAQSYEALQREAQCRGDVPESRVVQRRGAPREVQEWEALQR